MIFTIEYRAQTSVSHEKKLTVFSYTLIRTGKSLNENPYVMNHFVNLLLKI